MSLQSSTLQYYWIGISLQSIDSINVLLGKVRRNLDFVINCTEKWHKILLPSKPAVYRPDYHPVIGYQLPTAKQFIWASTRTLALDFRSDGI